MMRNNRWLIHSLLLVVITGGLTLIVSQSNASTSVTLRIEGSDQTYFDGAVTVDDCVVTDTAGATHAFTDRVICALVAAGAEEGFDYEFQDFGFGLFLKRIGSNDTPADFSQSWNFFIQYDPASTGLDGHTISSNEDILLAFTGFPSVPLRITGLPDHDPIVGEILTLHVEKRVGEYDDQFVWHGRWESAEGATLKVGAQTYSVPVDGNVVVTLETPGALVVQATGSDLIRSQRTTVSVVAVSPSPSPSASPSPSLLPSPSPSASPSFSPSPSPIVSPSPSPMVAGISTGTTQSQVERALRYLRSRQGDNGEIDGAVTSGWSALAFGAHSERARDIRSGDHNLHDGLTLASLQSATDVERQILAVRAGGENPRSFNGRDLVALLKSYYKDHQIGEPALINDDIFGVLALLAARESVGIEHIQSTVGTIITRQGTDGGWENIDITAAAIQALRAYRQAGGNQDVDDALRRARQYLKDHQDTFGGFAENSATTSWAIQAIHALGENPQDWKNINNHTPLEALGRYQNDNGGFGWKSSNDPSAFMTAYAIPALLGQPLPITLLNFSSGGSLVEPLVVLTPTPSLLPKAALAQVKVNAGNTSTATSTVLDSTSSLSNQSSPSPLPSPEGAVAGAMTMNEMMPLQTKDRRFMLTVFSLANVGIGVMVARLASKFLGL